MQKAVIAIVVIIILGVGGWALTHNNNSSTANNSSSSNQTANTSAQQPISTDTVTIQNFSFSPADITVTKGTKVTWTNKDSTRHTVTENDGKNGPSAPPLDPGKSYSFTFNQSGTFHYHCSIHPEMTGTVTVTDNSTAQPQSSAPATTPAQNNTVQGNPYP